MHANTDEQKQTLNEARGEIIERLIGQYRAAGYYPVQNSLNPAESLLYDAMRVMKQPATDTSLIAQLTTANATLRDQLEAAEQMAEQRGRQNLESQQKLADMAAENATLNSAIEAVQWAADNSEGIAGWHSNGDTAMWNEVIPEIFNIVMPNTDAYLNSVRAEGVDMFAVHLRTDKTEASVCKMIALGADDFSAKLRSGKDGE